jgi:hypothetical protein
MNRAKQGRKFFHKTMKHKKMWAKQVITSAFQNYVCYLRKHVVDLKQQIFFE